MKTPFSIERLPFRNIIPPNRTIMALSKTNHSTGAKPAASDSIATIKYPVKRKNIPPAGLEAQGKIQEAPRLRFEYNPKWNKLARALGDRGIVAEEAFAALSGLRS